MFNPGSTKPMALEFTQNETGNNFTDKLNWSNEGQSLVAKKIVIGE